MSTTRTKVPQSHNSRSSIADAVHESYAKAEKCIRHQPESAMLISLATGMGVGLAIGLLLSRPNPSPSYGWFDRRSAERVGHRIMDAIGGIIPDAISDRLS